MKFENIYIDANDDVSTIVERILNSESSNFVIFVPEDSILAESEINFKLLAREAKSAGKKIFLQDDSEEKIISMAEEAGISTLEQKIVTKPKASKATFFRDIAPPVKTSRGRKPSQAKDSEPKEETKNIKVKERVVESSRAKSMDSFGAVPVEVEEIKASELVKKNKNKKSSFKFSKKIGSLLILLGGILIVIFLAFYFLTNADLVIITRKASWETQSPVLASKVISENDDANSKIPAQYMKLSRQINEDFSTTGIKDVSVKSSGKIKIYNAYSSSAQNLVANTRFLSPDGKIFKITKAVTVPGAKIENGSIIPSYIEVAVVADQPGEQYNISPCKFTIPGFKGSAKYDKFYGESENAMAGGYIGEAKVASQSDLDNSRAKLVDLAKISLEEELMGKLPEGFKVLDDAKVFTVEKEGYSVKAGDKAESFQTSLSASLKVLVFKESDVKDLFTKTAQSNQVELLDKELYSADFQYGVPRVDFEKGILSFPVNAKLVFRDRIKTDSFKDNLTGMSMDKLGDYLRGVEGVEDMSCSITPGFIRFLPIKSSNIHITLD
ncbi:MAG TPA: hypothetical protein PLQ44_02125 [Candidatus Paceibacterota bacterium]|nr:hypothetical protein [Candidatus Paceibacterota bacterium]HPT40376.1 hypothetical protein [Candidatus Paceibacterota bacterium]